MNVRLLEPARPFKGAEIAEPGRWLIIFKYNRAVALYSAGAKIRRFFDAPVLGASVANLDTTPQDVVITVRDVRTYDGYRLSALTVRLQVRITPDEEQAGSALLQQINDEGEKFFEGVVARIRQEVEVHSRATLAKVRAVEVVNQGPSTLIFPAGALNIQSVPFVSVTSVQAVDWEEAALAREVRLAEERRVADEDREKLDEEARERAARALIHQELLNAQYASVQHDAEAELESRKLELAIAKARRIGVDPVALVEPKLWGQLAEQHSSVLIKLLESSHLYPMIRSSPELLTAILHRLSGGNSSIPLGRQADMVLDGIDPSRLDFPSLGKVHAPVESSAYLAKAGLKVDPLIEEVWINSGGSSPLTGAGFAEAPSQRAGLVLVLAKARPVIPATFETSVIDGLRGAGRNIEKVGVKAAAGSTLDEAVQQFVRVISPSVTTSLSLREVRDRREAYVELRGQRNDAQKVFDIMTDPQNPILPTLESLIGESARIRFAPPIV
ncbi:hypothetical protein J2S98_002563 [Arthrobacter oryzae]|uniref:hypothetical protein n=1 Tax=Arthrobacter oryzae TaxID=409290 RepID=UPI002781265D|nr:hypothetical protein [Arthrobacter oryzae]MDP9987396.1 hypothetical protein [Arthrobacter oryzae]